jgi:multiple sugar transport system substrate-binding protein
MRVVKGRIVPCAVLSTSLLALAACGGVGGGGDSEPDSSGGKVTITTMGFGLPDEIATTRVDAFKADNADIGVDVVEGDFDEQQFLSALSSGDAPDAVYLNRDDIGTYASRGAIVPLDDCLDQQSVDMGKFRDAAVQQVTIDDHVYGLPEFNQTRVLIVNTEAASEAGVDPTAISTGDWTGLESAAQAMAQRSGSKLSRIGYDPKLPEFLPLWARANGASLLSDDGMTATLDDPKVVEALDFAAKLVADQGGWSDFKAFRDTWDFFGGNNEFAANQLGAMPMEDWYLNVLAENSPDAPIAVEPFLDREGNPLTYATGSAWAIPKGADHPEQACKFIASMTSTESWVAAAKARAQARADAGLPYTGTYTANEEADQQIASEVWKPSGNEALDAGVQVLSDVQAAAFSLPPSPAGAEVKQAWMDAAQRVLNGEQSAADALARAQEEAQAAIDAAGS